MTAILCYITRKSKEMHNPGLESNNKVKEKNIDDIEIDKNIAYDVPIRNIPV